MKRELILDPDTGELIPSYPHTPNEVILGKRQQALNAIPHAKVGDYVRLLNGSLHRFTIDHGDRLQHDTGGSFYLGHKGCDFSGACGDSIPRYKLIEVGVKEGSVWFFSEDIWGAGRGYHTNAIFKVWEEVDEDHLNDAQQKQRSKSASRAIKQAVEFWGYDSLHMSYRFSNL